MRESDSVLASSLMARFSKTRQAIAVVCTVLMYLTLVINSEELEGDLFTEIGADLIAFPNSDSRERVARPISARKGEWVFTVSEEPDRRVLIATLGDRQITQSVTSNAIFKRFAFDTQKQRFEPMRQEIRIEDTSEKGLQELEGLTGVTAVKRYERLGFSIVKLEADVNPVEIFRNLTNELNVVNARILTGFIENEPL